MKTDTISHKGSFSLEEEAVRLIGRSFDQPWASRAALLCYLTACRKVNLRNSVSFDEPISGWAQDMHMPYREAQQALALLESIGLLKIERHKITGTKANGISTYTLTLLRNDITFIQGDITSASPEGSASHPSQEHSQQRTTQEHSQERLAASDKSEVSKRPKKVLRLVNDGDIETLKADPAFKGLDVQATYDRMLSWCLARRKHPTYLRFHKWLLGDAQSKQVQPATTRTPQPTKTFVTVPSFVDKGEA